MAVIYLKIKDQIISDLPYWSANGPDVGYITDKSAAIASAYDYYPFGMLMPDRYVSDTSSQCMTVTQTRWVTTWVDSCYDVPLFDGIHLSDLTVFYLNGAMATADSGLLVFDAQRIDASISLEGLSVIPNAAQSITFDIDEVKSGSARIEVSEIAGGQRVILGSALADSRSLTEIDFVPGGNNVTVDLVGPFERLAVRTICVKRPVPVEQTYLVDVCSGLKDRYRFGFNGQEKVNEWAGIGNHLDFEERGYDSRTGRWLSIDPKFGKYPLLTPYNFTNNNPILFVDHDGRNFGVKINNTEKTIVIVATVYPTNDIAYKQAQAGATLWNAKETMVEGYKVTFQVNVQPLLLRFLRTKQTNTLKKVIPIKKWT